MTRIRYTLAAALVALALPSLLRAQATPFDDSLLPRVRALAASVPGERPQAIHVMKILESAGPLRNYVAVDDSTRVASCFPVFQIRWRDRWIVVDAALDSLESGTDDKLLNAVCDAIDVICDSPGDRQARAEQLRTTTGTPVWKVAVRTHSEDWVVLWWPRGEFADIYYIGPL